MDRTRIDDQWWGQWQVVRYDEWYANIQRTNVGELDSSPDLVSVQTATCACCLAIQYILASSTPANFQSNAIQLDRPINRHMHWRYPHGIVNQLYAPALQGQLLGTISVS